MSAVLLRRLGLVLALVLVMGLVVVPTSAQCTQNTFTGNDSYTCGPNDEPAGLDVGTGNDTVTVTDSITLGGTEASIYSGGGTVWLVVDIGDTLETDDHAVLVDNGGNIIASGRVISQSHGLYVRDGDGNITFGSGTTYDPANYLEADDVAMWVQGEGNITNSGEVDAGTAGLFVGDLDNLLDGDLSSTEGVNALLDVSGITGGTITNYGDVDGGLFGAAMIGTGTIDNQGVLEGDIASVAAIGSDMVINNGSELNTDATIEEGAVGVFGYGSGTVNNYGTTHADGVGMVLISQVQLGEGSLEQIQAAGSELEFYLGIADLVNNMEFEGEWTVNNDGRIEAPVGVLLLGNGTVNNNGVIDAGFLGIGAYGNADLNNAGTIQGSLVGAALIGQVGIDTEFLGELFDPANAADVQDSEDALGFLFYVAAALNAIEFEGGGTITNSGDIGFDEVGNYDAAAVGTVLLGNGSSINTETGRINAAYVGMAQYGNGEMVNAGEIGTGGVGMLFIGDLSFDDELFFDIEEVFAQGFGPGDMFGPINFGTGTIVNSGDIYADLAGIAAIGNVTITNTEDGDIDYAYVGIAGIGPVVSITNEGEIGTFGSVGLGIIGAGDDVEITNNGEIQADDVGVMAYGSGTINNSNLIIGDEVGIDVHGDFTVNLSDGSETGGYYVAVVGDDANQTVNIDGDVFNANVIPSVVDLQGGRDRVNLRDDAHVDGDIQMGDGDDTVQIDSGARAHGLIDGGDHNRGDMLIVGDEDMCAEDEDASERVGDVRRLVDGIDLSGDSFNFDGEGYDIEDFEFGRSGVRSHRCYHFIEDGRINAYDMGAPVAGYCNVEEGLNVWAIDEEGHGQVDFSVSAAQMRAALEQAVNGGSNVQIAAGARGSSLWALSSNQYQMMRLQPDGKTYAYIFEPGRCGPGGEIIVP